MPDLCITDYKLLRQRPICYERSAGGGNFLIDLYISKKGG
jgi:hypothetical protein